MREALVRNIEEGKKNYDNCLKTALPPLITKPEDASKPTERPYP